VLDPAVFPNASTLKLDANLGRLTATSTLGAKESDSDTQFERIFVPGPRSFSIRSADGELVYDSGDAFEKIIEARLRRYSIRTAHPLPSTRAAIIKARNLKPR
jgi:hypothetical protein